MKKVIFGVGSMITGILLCIVAIMISQVYYGTVLPDILIMIGFLLSMFGIITGIIGLIKKD